MYAPYLARTLPALPYSTTKLEGFDSTAEDHAPDALRYVLINVGGSMSSRWMQPSEMPTVEEVPVPSLASVIASQFADVAAGSGWEPVDAERIANAAFGVARQRLEGGRLAASCATPPRCPTASSADSGSARRFDRP